MYDQVVFISPYLLYSRILQELGAVFFRRIPEMLFKFLVKQGNVLITALSRYLLDRDRGFGEQAKCERETAFF